MNFTYPHLERLSIDLIVACDEKLSYSYSVDDVTVFFYYKLSKAAKPIFRKHKLNNSMRLSSSKTLAQFNLALE